MRDSIPSALAAINTVRQKYARERKRFVTATEADLAALDFDSLFRAKEDEIEGYMSTYRTFKNMT